MSPGVVMSRVASVICSPAIAPRPAGASGAPFGRLRQRDRAGDELARSRSGGPASGCRPIPPRCARPCSRRSRGGRSAGRSGSRRRGRAAARRSARRPCAGSRRRWRGRDGAGVGVLAGQRGEGRGDAGGGQRGAGREPDAAAARAAVGGGQQALDLVRRSGRRPAAGRAVRRVRSSVGLQGLAEGFAAAAQQRADGRGAAAERAGDRVVGQVVDVAQRQRGALAWAAAARAGSARGLARSSGGSWCGSSGTVGRRLRRRVSSIALRTAILCSQASSFSRVLERAGALDGDDRHLLRDVLRGGGVAEDAERRAAGDGERAGGDLRAGIDAEGAGWRRRSCLLDARASRQCCSASVTGR